MSNNQKLKKFIMIFIANVFSAIAFNGFLIPNNLLSGGIGGLAVMFFYLTGISTAIFVIGINIPLFALGQKFVDKEFAFNSIVSMLCFSFLLSITGDISSYVKINDLLIETILGGVLNGIGMGILFSNKSSQGGTDIIAAVIKRKFNIPLGTILMSINAIILSISSVLFGFRLAMYTIIALFVSYQVMDKVKRGINPEQNAMIISSESDTITREITDCLNRSATLVEGQGAYSKNVKQIIYCTLPTIEIGKLKEIVENVDPSAFIAINDLSEVRGGGFKRHAF